MWILGEDVSGGVNCVGRVLFWCIHGLLAGLLACWLACLRVYACVCLLPHDVSEGSEEEEGKGGGCMIANLLIERNTLRDGGRGVGD